MKKNVCLMLFALMLLEPLQNAFAFYNPTAGRWLNRDPKEEEGGLNLYAFCGNDGINNHDPNGEASRGWRTYMAIADAAVQLTRVTHGDDPSRGGSLAVQAAEWQNRVRQYITSSQNALTQSSGGPDPKNRFYQHKGGWDFKGRAAAAALGVLGTSLYVASGQAETDSARFAQDAIDWTRHRMDGDTGLADLDAAIMAIDVINLSGSDYAATMMWGKMED